MHVGLKYAECHISKSGTRMTQQQPGATPLTPAINPHGEKNAITQFDLALAWFAGLPKHEHVSEPHLFGKGSGCGGFFHWFLWVRGCFNVV